MNWKTGNSTGCSRNIRYELTNRTGCSRNISMNRQTWNTTVCFRNIRYEQTNREPNKLTQEYQVRTGKQGTQQDAAGCIRNELTNRKLNCLILNCQTGRAGYRISNRVPSRLFGNIRNE
jgi:hypothetical protein